MKLNPFMRCECGKIHIVTFVSKTTKCTCGRELWRRVWTS